MKVTIAQKLNLGGDCPALIIPVVQGGVSGNPLVARLNRRLGGQLLSAAEQEKFVGKVGQTATFNMPSGRGVRRVCLVGLGDAAGLDSEKYRRAAGKASDFLRAWRVSSAVMAATVPPRGGAMTAGDICTAVVEGMTMGLYRFEKYKSVDEDNPPYAGLDDLELFLSDGRGAVLKQIAEALPAVAKRARIVSAAVLAARDLVNEIPAELTPQRLAEKAVQVASSHSGLSCRVLDEKEMEKEKMGATLAVGRGSANPPRFIELSWEPRKPVNKDELLVMVGKGVCFDSGGLNIKPGEHMATMKMDMAGAAAVISSICAIAELKLPVRVKAVVAAVENMPGGRSYKPDDIVRALDGTTIEIGNTDAEGRLTLADALGWAHKELGATKMIDFATLTGACVVGLGPSTAGLFGSDEDWAGKVSGAASSAGEKFCRLPLDEDMRNDIKSEAADVRNIGTTRWGGAITAALFLQKFTGETPWVHMDIAGPAWCDRRRHYLSHGGTGYGVRLLVSLAEDMAIGK